MEESGEMETDRKYFISLAGRKMSSNDIMVKVFASSGLLFSSSPVKSEALSLRCSILNEVFLLSDTEVCHLFLVMVILDGTTMFAKAFV